MWKRFLWFYHAFWNLYLVEKKIPVFSHDAEYWNSKNSRPWLKFIKKFSSVNFVPKHFIWDPILFILLYHKGNANIKFCTLANLRRKTHYVLPSHTGKNCTSNQWSLYKSAFINRESQFISLDKAFCSFHYSLLSATHEIYSMIMPLIFFGNNSHQLCDWMKIQRFRVF